MFGATTVDPKRVSIYIRWSTEEQGNGTTLEVQRDACFHFIKSQGWEVREDLIFIDDGYSGGNISRPALTTLRKQVTEGLISAVVVYKLDRLSRNLLDCVTLVRQEWSKIALFSTMERFDTHSSLGQMVFNLLVSFAEFERNVIRERTMSGKRKRREQARNSGFKYPYGYRKSESGDFEIDPGPADVVRGMFADYLAGSGYAPIVDRLNGQGLSSPGGGQWRQCTVRAMLMNPFYAGHYVAGYYTYHGGKQKRGKEPSVVMRDAVPALIPQTDFERAQELRQSRQRGGPPTSPRDSDYILSSVLRCAGCGGPMVGHNGAGDRKRYYRCVNGKEFRSCECGSIPKEDLEQAVLEAVRRDLSPEHLQAHLDNLEAHRRREVEVHRAQVQTLLARESELQRRREKLDADYMEGRLEARQYGRLAERADADLVFLGGQVDQARERLQEAEHTQFNSEMLWSLVQRIDSVADLPPEQVRHLLRRLLASVRAYRVKSKGRYNTTPIEVTVEHNVRLMTTA